MGKEALLLDIMQEMASVQSKTTKAQTNLQSVYIYHNVANTDLCSSINKTFPSGQHDCPLTCN